VFGELLVRALQPGLIAARHHDAALGTQDEAEHALATLLLKVEQPKTKGATITLAQAAERYLAGKARKRTVAEDRRLLAHLKSAFGADTPLVDITASRISEYKAARLNGTSARTKRALTAAGVNRPLALLRHLLRLAHDEWELLAAVPKVRLEREPQGRIRWLEPDEEARLLASSLREVAEQEPAHHSDRRSKRQPGLTTSTSTTPGTTSPPGT